MKKLFWFLLLFFLVGLELEAQTCYLTLSGFVLDKQDKTPMSFVLVHVQELAKEVYTDDRGYYHFEDLCPGEYHISLTHLACSTQTHFLSLTQSEQKDFILDHQHFLLDEIQVKSTSPGQLNSSVARKISEDNLLDRTGQSFGAIVAMVPGVSSLQSGSGISKPVIHGLTGNRIAIYNQDIPVEGQQWGLDHATELDPNVLENVSIITNGAAIRYGMQAQGGMILAKENWQNSDPHWHGNIKSGYQSNGNQALAYGHLRKSFGQSQFILKGGASFSGDKKTPDYYMTNTGHRQATGSASFLHWQGEKKYNKFFYSFYANETGIFRGAHISNLTDLQEALHRTVPFFSSDTFTYTLGAPRQQVFHHLAKYTLFRQANQDLAMTVNVGWQLNQRKEFDVRRSGRSDIPALYLSLWSQFYEINLKKKNIEWGSQIRAQINRNNPETGILPLIPDFNQVLGALYGQASWSRGTAEMETGARVEYTWFEANANRLANRNLNSTFINLATYFGLRIPLNVGREYSTNLTLMRRSPYIHELLSNGLHQGVAGIEEGNPDLKQENSSKWTHDFKGETAHHRYHMSLYAQYFHNYIFLEPANELRVTIRGTFPVFKYQTTNAVIAGFSALSEWELSHKGLWVNQIQYIRAQDLLTGHGLVFIPPLQIKSRYEHNFTGFLFFREINLGGEIVYTGKAGYVDPRLDFAPPPGDYWLVNVHAKFKWKMLKSRDCIFIVNVNNLTNTKYRDYLNRLRYFTDELGITISGTLSFNF